jgi:hypothetical protein
MSRAEQIVGVTRISSKAQIRRREIIGCAVVGSLGVLILDALILGSVLGYDFDDKIILYSVAVQNAMARVNIDTWFRPLEYFVFLAANQIYLPLWLVASLLCAVGTTILSALACELLFQRKIPQISWWILGIANPLLFYLVSTPGTVSQSLCNLLFAGCLLAFTSELQRRPDKPLSGWRADTVAPLLNVTAAALFFTKELAVAAGVVLPAASALIRLKRRKLSPIFLFSLLLPIGSAATWIAIKMQLPLVHDLLAGGRYGVKGNPITWGENVIMTLAFPLTPLPSSFISFAILRPFWVVVALGSVTVFIILVVRECIRHPDIVLPLLVVATCCIPMIFIHSSEVYSTMIAPFAVSILFLIIGARKMRGLSLIYGLLLYSASLGNGIVYLWFTDFSSHGLQRLPYSIYSESHQQDPTCPIAKTAHVALRPVTEKRNATSKDGWWGAAITCVQ